MSEAYYMSHPNLHYFLKYFQSSIRYLQVGNGALFPALFVIPLVFKIQGHKFEVVLPWCQKSRIKWILYLVSKTYLN